MSIVVGMIFLAIGGGLLHDVPFTRFLLAFTFIILGNSLMHNGYGVW